MLTEQQYDLLIEKLASVPLDEYTPTIAMVRDHDNKVCALGAICRADGRDDLLMYPTRAFDYIGKRYPFVIPRHLWGPYDKGKLSIEERLFNVAMELAADIDTEQQW